MGAVNIRLSRLSRIPPWPGIKVPESLIPEPLFNTDSNKSPTCAMIDIIKPRESNSLKDKFNQFFKANVAAMPNIIPPIDPSMVFLGLILGNILFLPNLVPIR